VKKHRIQGTHDLDLGADQISANLTEHLYAAPVSGISRQVQASEFVVGPRLSDRVITKARQGSEQADWACKNCSDQITGAT